MKRLILLLLLLAFTTTLKASEELVQNLKFTDFSAAKNSPTNIRFEVFSTKVGIFTSRVPGYVLEAKATAQRSGSDISQMKLLLKADSLNTDSEARDEKLHGLCLETKSYPEIEVLIPGPAKIGTRGSYAGVMTIRGKQKNIQVNLSLEEHDGHVTATGDALVGLKQLEIPDPSIAIATLEDRINIIFKLAVSR